MLTKNELVQRIKNRVRFCQQHSCGFMIGRSTLDINGRLDNQTGDSVLWTQMNRSELRIWLNKLERVASRIEASKNLT